MLSLDFKQLLGESSAHTATISPIEENPFPTEVEKDKMETKEKDIKFSNVEKEQETKPIPLTIVKPTTKPTHETKIIGSSSRPQLTDPIFKVQVPQPESSHATPKPDRENGIARDTDEPPRKLVLASTKVHQDPDALEKELILLMVKAADLEISMHGDYYGMLVTDPKR
ncbi:hypothetical protein Tco_0207229 [Tanacetum coccineum]